jgi:hypothetical protein
MPQIKLGFDRIPIPTTTKLEELKNFPTGETLRDRTGNLLYTEVETPLAERAKVKNATSTFINNDEDNPVKIEEQFPATSEVSSTLLGIDRAETQLSLFSDVSSYGLNEEEFEYFSGPALNLPITWYQRNSDLYGRHTALNFIEETNEQALVMSIFPVPYTFPYGPEFAETRGDYQPALYEKYLAFVRLGNLYYDMFVEAGFQSFADKHFLPVSMLNAPTQSLSVNYGVNFTKSEIFDQVGRWTFMWMDIRDGIAIDARNLKKLEFLPGYDSDNTQPGQTSDNGVVSVLQTKKAYRYQPGRISGFTFGFKCSFDPASTQNIIEWGTANSTDMYMFQVKGSRLAVVRRSTVPLPQNILQQMGLTIQDQRFVPNPAPFEENSLYEIEITQDLFNGDTMDGNGKSGYNIDVTKVTMYKVEFGWYGAIGARFLAYVPTGNGDCRWVVMHTIIIENGMGQPCLADPYFKFKYILDINETSFLRSPQFLYKYGASCYIDGGDDNAGEVYSYNSNQVVSSFITLTDRDDDGDIDEADLESTIGGKSILGIQPKEQLINVDGIGVNNKRDTYIEDLKVITDALAQLDIVEIGGCPGFGHHYAPTLRSNETGIYFNTLSFTEDRTQMLLTDGETFSDLEDGTKMIGPGLVNFYLQKDPLSVDDTSAYFRREGIIGPNITTFNEKIPEKLNVNDELVEFFRYDTTQIKFTKYNALAASDLPLTGEKINVNFLNSRQVDNYGIEAHNAEYFVGISFDKPKVVFTPNEELVFEDRNTGIDRSFDLEQLVMLNFTPDVINTNESGIELSEGLSIQGDVKMEMDFRIDRPAGEDTGNCSQITITEEPKQNYNVIYSSTLKGDSYPVGNYLTFDLEPVALVNATVIVGAEIGQENPDGTLSGSGMRFTSDIIVNKYFEFGEELTQYAVSIDTVPLENAFKIFLSPIKIADPKVQFKVYFGDFNFKPVYVIIGMRDNAEVCNISIAETKGNKLRSFVPTWLTNDNVTVKFSGGSSPGLPPTNFESTSRLSSNNVDTQLQQPLRPGKNITTVFVHPNNKDLIKLTNVYGADRQIITPGALNSKATFIRARNLDQDIVNKIIVSLVTREI